MDIKINDKEVIVGTVFTDLCWRRDYSMSEDVRKSKRNLSITSKIIFFITIIMSDQYYVDYDFPIITEVSYKTTKDFRGY